MPISKAVQHHFMKRLFTICIYIFIPISVFSQVIWENHRSEVYPYLYRMAQKGLIEFHDMIQPLSRAYIGERLMQLDSLRTKLSKTEKSELDFYLQEFKPLYQPNNQLGIVAKDQNKRLRGLFYSGKDIQLYADPMASVMHVNGLGQSFTQTSNGLQFWGQAGKFGFQFYYRDYTERGTGLDSFRAESPETNIIKLFSNNPQKQNFTEVRAHISYAWKNGSISIGKDQLIHGYGENGRIILSDKAPSYPFIRFDYQPLKWLRFHYANAWLNSNIIDSNATYGTGNPVSTGTRIQYIPKYLATHAIIISPKKGIDLSIGESIVYSDNMDLGFLIPINFFKVYDNNRSNYDIRAGSNGQFFFQGSARNILKNTHFYTTVFIDEIRVSTMFNKQKSRNQLGYTVGASITDIVLPYLTIGTEYTRVNPFVYGNLVPAQLYTQHSAPLGDWMGNNFDRFILFAKYTPIPKLRTYFRIQQIQKGGAGTVVQQYEAEPQPPFLFDFQKKRTDLFMQVGYEWLNNLYFNANYLWLNEERQNGQKLSGSRFSIGVSYGLR
ncbi:MAG: hypothetical protein RIR90_1812 [Bacteroidota bacterium]